MLRRVTLWFSPSDTRERGAWVGALGSACACSRERAGRLRVITRPGERLSFPAWTFEEFGGFTEGPCQRSPGPWLPVLAPVLRVRIIPKILDPPVPNPEAMHAKFVSPRRPGETSPCPRWLAPHGLLSAQRPRTPRQPPALSSRSFGRPRNLPPTGHRDKSTQPMRWEDNPRNIFLLMRVFSGRRRKRDLPPRPRRRLRSWYPAAAAPSREPRGRGGHWFRSSHSP
jgi:hypothetical protein